MSASIQLKRHCKPLLQTVQGQQRVSRRGGAAASPPAPTRTAQPENDDENLTRSPQSTDDEDANPTTEDFPAKRLGSAHYQSQAQMDSARSVDAQRRQLNPRPGRKRKIRGFDDSDKLSTKSKSKGRETAKAQSGKVSPIDDGDEQLFAEWHSSQSSRPATYKRTLKTVNIHAPASKEAPSFTSFIDIPPLNGTSTTHTRSKQAQAGPKSFIAPPSLHGPRSSTSPSSSYTTFKDPSTAPDTLDMASLSAPSSPISSPLSSPVPSSPPPTATSPDINCPMCNAPAPRTLYETFNQTNTRLTLREQRAFCLAHRRATALTQWNERGYPTIDWTLLPTKVSRYRARLEDVACRRRPSRYRDALDLRERQGRSRNDFRGAVASDGAHTRSPGYYGMRGARALLDHVTELFKANVPRELQADRLFAFAGFSGYLQAVLVPELALWLVMEDMSVLEERAVEILAESEAVGELVNGEESLENESL